MRGGPCHPAWDCSGFLDWVLRSAGLSVDGYLELTALIENCLAIECQKVYTILEILHIADK